MYHLIISTPRLAPYSTCHLSLPVIQCPGCSSPCNEALALMWVCGHHGNRNAIKRGDQRQRAAAPRAKLPGPPAQPPPGNILSSNRTTGLATSAGTEIPGEQHCQIKSLLEPTLGPKDRARRRRLHLAPGMRVQFKTRVGAGAAPPPRPSGGSERHKRQKQGYRDLRKAARPAPSPARSPPWANPGGPAAATGRRSCACQSQAGGASAAPPQEWKWIRPISPQDPPVAHPRPAPTRPPCRARPRPLPGKTPPLRVPSN